MVSESSVDVILPPNFWIFPLHLFWLLWGLLVFYIAVMAYPLMWPAAEKVWNRTKRFLLVSLLKAERQ